MAAEVTWENVRFSVLTQIATNGFGNIRVPFAPAFPSVCHGIDVSLDDSGGTRGWCLGILGVDNTGFYAAISDVNGNAVVGAILGVHYLAFGE